MANRDYSFRPWDDFKGPMNLKAWEDPEGRLVERMKCNLQYYLVNYVLLVVVIGIFPLFNVGVRTLLIVSYPAAPRRLLTLCVRFSS